jgi:hypothetical protein
MREREGTLRCVLPPREKEGIKLLAPTRGGAVALAAFREGRAFVLSTSAVDDREIAARGRRRAVRGTASSVHFPSCKSSACSTCRVRGLADAGASRCDGLMIGRGPSLNGSS